MFEPFLPRFSHISTELPRIDVNDVIWFELRNKPFGRLFKHIRDLRLYKETLTMADDGQRRFAGEAIAIVLQDRFHAPMDRVSLRKIHLPVIKRYFHDIKIDK